MAELPATLTCHRCMGIDALAKGLGSCTRGVKASSKLPRRSRPVAGNTAPKEGRQHKATRLPKREGNTRHASTDSCKNQLELPGRQVLRCLAMAEEVLLRSTSVDKSCCKPGSYSGRFRLVMKHHPAQKAWTAAGSYKALKALLDHI